MPDVRVTSILACLIFHSVLAADLLCPPGMANLKGDFTRTFVDILSNNHKVQALAYHAKTEAVFVSGSMSVDNVLYPFVYSVATKGTR